MPKHAERRVLPFTREQMFGLVADVEKYPEFLPWCVSTRIVERDESDFTAEMRIGFRVLRESFLTRVETAAPDRIDVTYLDGPFRYLTNRWLFEDGGDGSCTVDFSLDFEFRNVVLRRLLGVVFTEAVHRMVAAFETRARALYG